ncbi:unnamed protein product [Caenorhabditis angaria]|uniref:Uncharacterized protein n=1 Tax=Caenorhabditis angaria TaxID=860376 RepID=A0A9P1N3U8_9PELO|nr:unnamed protein product [Caenorhabditis angaria]
MRFSKDPQTVLIVSQSANTLHSKGPRNYVNRKTGRGCGNAVLSRFEWKYDKDYNDSWCIFGRFSKFCVTYWTKHVLIVSQQSRSNRNTNKFNSDSIIISIWLVKCCRWHKIRKVITRIMDQFSNDELLNGLQFSRTNSFDKQYQSILNESKFFEKCRTSNFDKIMEQHVSDVISIDLNIQISKLKLEHSFSCLELFWMCFNGAERDEERTIFD